ncbi:hypothetical protein MHU86_2535 [Fragilaria crotonensis]|nr:hypothetical protein MHU86_2535 [Fragilaria crotonensis]
MANPAPTRSPPTKANPPSAHCVKPTKHMANYVAADGDFAAPFDALKNAVFPCNFSNIYVATSNHATNTYSTAETNPNTPKKSTNKTPGDFQRARTALTPEQESATISRFLALVEQERAQDTKTRVTYACKPSNEAGSTEMEDSLLASYERPIKKQRVSFDTNVEIIKNKDNNEVAKCDSFKIPAFNAEDLSNDKRGTIRTVSESAFQCTSPIRNPTITRREIVETAKPIKLFQENARFTTVLPEDALPENSDDAILSGDERAFEQDLTDLNPPEIGGERDETVTAEMDDNHSKKRKFMYGADNEYTPATPEHVVFPPGTVFTAVSTTDEQFFREHCPSTPGHATRFYPHRINAVIHRGRVFFPGTPPSTTSGRTRGISVTSLPDENTPVHGDAINGPGHNDGIGPMSERDPGIENAVNPNFNDDICENVLAVVNIRNPNKTNGRNIHQDSSQDEIEIPYVELPSHGHHPRVCGHADVYVSSTATRNVRLPSPGHQDLRPYKLQPFYFQPISEDPHIFHPIVDSDDYETSSTACNASRLIQDPEALGSQRPSASTDIHLPSRLHPKLFRLYSPTSPPPTAPTTAFLRLQASPTSSKPCQVITLRIPTDLTPVCPPTDRQHIGPNPPCALPAALL